MIKRISINVLVCCVLVACTLPTGGAPRSLPETSSIPETSVPEANTATPVPTNPVLNDTATPPVEITAQSTLTPSVTIGPSAAAELQTTDFHYVPQSGTPAGVANFVQPEAGCNWTGLGGQVFNSQGVPVSGLVVEVGGSLEGREVLFLAITGSATTLGPGGFEITLADHPAASNGTLRIQIFNLQGVALSSLIAFNTFANCDRNMTLINFSEVSGPVPPVVTPGPVEHHYLPLIFK